MNSTKSCLMTLILCLLFLGLSCQTDSIRVKNNAPPRSTKRYIQSNIDKDEFSLNELRQQHRISSPEECDRTCQKGDNRICHYDFTLEIYTVNGAACHYLNESGISEHHKHCVLADGVERSILTANRMLPGPIIRVCEGDLVIVDVRNNIAGAEVTIHWHGIFQRDTPYYDGVPMVTQCPIMQGNTFRYQWFANAGTHFWHAHTGFQKLDGLFGGIIVRQPKSEDPSSHLYDYDLTEHVIEISDWIHEPAIDRYPGTLVNKTGQAPDNILINGKGQYENESIPLETFNVTRGHKYRFRLINSFAGICPAHITIQGHKLTVIATDGSPIRSVVVDTINSFSAERYDFVIDANQPIGAYWIRVRSQGFCSGRLLQQYAILRYQNGPKEPLSSRKPWKYMMEPIVKDLRVLNKYEGNCKSSNDICIHQLDNANRVDETLLKNPPDYTFKLFAKSDVYENRKLFKPDQYKRFEVFADGRHAYSVVNNISYVSTHSPPLTQLNDIPTEAFCNNDTLKDRSIDHGPHFCTHKIDIPLGNIVELIVIDDANATNISHPFHLHGHAFHVMYIGRSQADLHEEKWKNGHIELPPGKDTIAVPRYGYVVLRFKADNPGYWLFHCHFLFHLIGGMNVLLHVGEQKDLPPVPKNFPKCNNFLPEVKLPTFARPSGSTRRTQRPNKKPDLIEKYPPNNLSPGIINLLRQDR